MRRRAPRPPGEALTPFAAEYAPQTLLARVQSCWRQVVGRAIAQEAQPTAERGGTVTVTCRSAAWASELELLAPELIEKLNGALGEGGEGRVEKLRAKVGRIT